MRSKYQLAQDTRRPMLLREVEARRSHDERMANGCLCCGTAVVGRVCPDCYVCMTCAAFQPGCDECSPN